MKKKDLFGDDVQSDKEDFESLFNSQLDQGLRKLSPGDNCQAEILAISKDDVFVQLTPAIEGVLHITEILGPDKAPLFKVGDRIDVVVTKIKNGDYRVSRKGNKTAAVDLDSLEDAFDMELPVEGKVVESCNGGFRVQLSQSSTLAFCPISQMDFRVTQEADYVGKKFEFLITQLDPRKRNIVVSRRRLLDLQRAENEGSFLQRMHVDDIVEGRVTRVESYGAFVEIEPQIEGLVHVSELSWSRVQDAKTAIQIGTHVRAKILKIDELDGRLKISLSIKQGGGESDPWLLIEQNFPIGSFHDGVVEKKEAYGLFVNVGPGVTGLLPRSKWMEHVDGKQFENKKKGDQVKVQVDTLMPNERKMSLGLPREQDSGEWKTHVAGKTSFGTFGDLLKKSTRS